ncbi:Bax inhibitor-1/YccA family membrane protein [Leucobacter chromiireducens]|uniref:Bax inhibitor-1/YccA family protein n=1 Tax=Leucobacter chromiireducens subsp. chromiireducens TaxID=660067 RepID=A0ABS1SLP5_9MICO|nr:Bax inhibitor-1/YccA family protein [Leucobacter chromiireducens]MBL3689083.1 Bax inhibitor-1/YccA family protein [Leucobacter chromiireducens subsp. chromiireducens]
MSNPALSNNPALNGKTLSADELRRIYDQPAAQTQRPGIDTPTEAGFGGEQPPVIAPSDKPMTYENTISKTVLLFLTVLAFGAVGWFMPVLAIPGAIAGLVLGLVNSFKKEPSVPLIVLYAVAQGLFLGGISGFYEAQWPGIVSQAVIGTLSVFGVTLLLFRSGKVRTSPRMTKIVLIAMVGYLVFSLVNFVLMLTGVTPGMFGARSIEIFGMPLGVVIGLLAVFLAAYSLVMDFELIQNGVRNRVPEKWAWSAAFGLMVTLIWLYVEILRLLAIFRGND